MRSPEAAFDLRAALAQELAGAVEDLENQANDPKSLHRCRVHLKRARALARIGRVCAPGLASVFNESARGVMRTLAHARELTALADTARAVAEQSGGNARGALLAAADALDAERASLPAFDLDRIHAEMKDLTALAQVWPELSPRQLRKGAQRLSKRAKHAYGDAHGVKDATPRHEWRQREKQRVFAASILAQDWPGPRRRKRGEKLGDLLGLERDALLLLERLKQRPELAGSEEEVERARRALRKYGVRMGRRADRIGRKLHS